MRRASISRVVVSAMIVAAAIGAVSFLGRTVSVFGGYQLQASDALFPTGKTDPRVVVVGVDARSIDAIGRWPWPRATEAKLVDRLSQAGARTITFDEIFDPPSKGDDQLAASIKASKRSVVLGALADLKDGAGTKLATVTSLTPPAPILQRAAANIGHTSVTPDPADGVVRSLPLIVDTPDGSQLPSLSLATLMQVDHLSGPFTQSTTGIQIGDRFIPTDEHAAMNVSYAPSPRMVSAADVLDGKAKLNGKIVLVGVTDPTLGDDKLSPVDKSNGTPGVFVHANALNTMLTSSYVFPPTRTATTTWVLILAFTVGLATLLLSIWIAAPLTVLVGIGYVVLAITRFDTGRVLDLIYPPLAIVVAFVASLALRYLSERRERTRVSALFSQYVPESVAKQLIEHGTDELTRERRVDVTVLFCDLRSFTATAAKLEPAGVSRLLDAYYDATTELVFQHGGTLMQYVGDEVYALFGAPIDDDHSSATALACAIDFQKAAPAINSRLAEQGLPTIAYGIGLHTGPVVTAHIGTNRRRQFSAIGDTVNCGSRLCSLAKAGEVVVSGDLFERLDTKPEVQALEPIPLKGVARDLHPFRIEIDASARTVVG